ncbi:type IV toxin-antitoxin system AbiEi family antitoxin domain-containing protein [uncultured Microbacterium sp.]|uniref:type IV toxin-antitoxin system AbiEi family antitoxin domain-containing protein n=1 Tax=uncultured Microbacterium sp. TaxID=191216 RepID=UPI0025FCF6E5|nr:type IV toxin-antitoxin system AbiEi family antitoxin domain-containing protein [uncultured Microbacterium sp.]
MAVLARDVLWELAASQHGYVTAQQAGDLGVTRRALNQLAARGTLEHAAFGVYRFPRYPFSRATPYMLAVLWTRAPEAVLSHETALDVREVCDVNPSVIDVTVGKGRRLRRQGSEQYVIHFEDLEPAQLAWWEEVPVVTLATAIAQCIESGTPTYLLSQAITNGRSQGYLTAQARDQLTEQLTAHRG